ncbi:MAG: hypothetical protein ACOYES_10210 [Bacillota bacterium]|jgi:hypothetical protein
MARETVIASFIMRFVKPRAAAATAGVEAGAHGSQTGARIAVRHVQSGYERRFVNLDDAMDFIREEIRLLEQD